MKIRPSTRQLWILSTQIKYSGASQYRAIVSRKLKSLDNAYLFFRFRSGRCVNAEPARLFVDFEVPLLRNALEAILPTRLEVFSLRPIFLLLIVESF